MIIQDVESHYVAMESELFDGLTTSSITTGHASYLIENMRDLWIQLPPEAQNRARERANTRSEYALPSNLPL
jgi:hypothetical protein